VTVFLSSTDPGSGAEELSADPAFLIKGPPDNNGKVIYYLTRAVKAYAVPDVPDPQGNPTIDVYFDNLAGPVYDAKKLIDDPTRKGVLAQADR
jgi:hypothetical protein